MRFAPFLLPFALWLSFAAVVYAEDQPDPITVSETTDYFVVIEVPQLFTAETDLCQGTSEYWCTRPEDGGYFVDSVLWLYNSAGELLAVNDDDPRAGGQSWNSYLSLQVDTGVYRLRAGRYSCDATSCIHPDDPFPTGGHYELITSVPLILDPNPPVVVPPTIPPILPTPEPTPTQTPEPPTPSPTVAPTPTPEPSTDPTPTPPPPPTLPPTPSPTPEPTPEPTPSPEVTDEPTARPTNTPAPTATPQPTADAISPSPVVSPDPTSVPTPEPTQPPLPNVGAAVSEVATAAVAAVSESVAAVGDGIANIAAIGEMGKDLDPVEKKEAQPMAVAIVSSQIASVAAAAANAARTSGGTPPSNGNLPEGGGGATGTEPVNNKSTSRKEKK